MVSVFRVLFKDFPHLMIMKASFYIDFQNFYCYAFLIYAHSIPGIDVCEETFF